MTDNLYTTSRTVSFRGPSTSDDYNLRIQQNYNDLTLINNKVQLLANQGNESYSRFGKDVLFLENTISGLESQLTNLEQAAGVSTLFNVSNIVPNLFTSTAYSIPVLSQLTYDSVYNMLTLPQVASSSISKLAYTDAASGTTVLPSSLSTTVTPVLGSAEDPINNPIIDTTPPELAIARVNGRIWQRNVLASAPNNVGAQCYLYIACPTGQFTNSFSNSLIFNAFPVFSTNIVSIEYTTNVAPTMQDSDGYQAFPALYVNNSAALGYVPPGSWGNGGDVINNAALCKFYFDPIPVTGLKIGLNQTNWFTQNGQYVYSYGASMIDLNYTKFLSTGSTIVQINPGVGQTISQINNVTPNIFNVAPYEIPNVFSYQTIWETAYGSGQYTTTSVPFSQRCWIMITLNATSNGGSPALSSLGVTYS